MFDVSFSLQAAGVVFLFFIAVGVLAAGGGWLLVTVDDRLRQWHAILIERAQQLAIQQVANDLRNGSWWFDEERRLLVLAIAESLSNHGSFRVDQVRDHILPKLIREHTLKKADAIEEEVTR